MKTLFTAEAISKGGRSGTIQTPDRLLNVTLGNPLEKGAEKRGPSPELLFAGAYSACYHGALSNAAKKLGTPTGDSTVRALVGLIEDDQGRYRLARPARIPRPCAATPLSGWWWTVRQSQPESCRNTLAVTRAANRRRQEK
jgi:organic hydroperoxide reductase OsmC/OhrA